MIYAENILLCIAVPFLTVLYFVRGSVRRFVVAFLLGMAVCLVSAYLGSYLGMLAGMGDETKVYLSPIVEELMKFFPLLLYILLFLPAEKDFFLAAIGIGSGFATFENCCYILSFGAGRLSYIMIRGLAVGVMHIVSVLMLALGLVMIRRFREMSFPGIFGALSLSVMFHGLYNLLVSEGGVPSYIGYALPLVTAFASVVPYRYLRDNAGGTARMGEEADT